MVALQIKTVEDFFCLKSRQAATRCAPEQSCHHKERRKGKRWKKEALNRKKKIEDLYNSADSHKDRSSDRPYVKERMDIHREKRSY